MGYMLDCLRPRQYFPSTRDVFPKNRQKSQYVVNIAICCKHHDFLSTIYRFGLNIAIYRRHHDISTLSFTLIKTTKNEF